MKETVKKESWDTDDVAPEVNAADPVAVSLVMMAPGLRTASMT